MTSARSRRTLPLPLVRECEVQTEKISQSDVKAVQDIEIHTKTESRVEFPKILQRKRKLSITSTDSQVTSDWMIIPPTRPSRFELRYGTRLPLRESKTSDAVLESDAEIKFMQLDRSDIKSILNNPTKFTEVCGYSGVDTAYLKVKIY